MEYLNLKIANFVVVQIEASDGLPKVHQKYERSLAAYQNQWAAEDRMRTQSRRRTLTNRVACPATDKAETRCLFVPVTKA